MSWLVASIVLSVVLTVGLNVFARGFPRTTERAYRRVDAWAADQPADGPRVRVFFPWKAMLLASIVLTVLVNLLAR